MLHQTIEKDLKDINLRVSDASKNLRIERVRLIKQKVKEVLGKDVNISIKDVNTDVKVQPNLNDLHTTAGIVSEINSKLVSRRTDIYIIKKYIEL